MARPGCARLAEIRLLGYNSSMRRLANQSRDDVYASSRDYQQIEDRQGVSVRPHGRGKHRLVFPIAESTRDERLVAIGGFLAPGRKASVSIELAGPIGQVTRIYALDPVWSRVSVGLRTGGDVTAIISWSGDVDLAIWGLSGGAVVLPAAISSQVSSDDQLLVDHLAPETFYFPHEAAIELDLSAEDSSHVTTHPGAQIHVKKCSYCGRYLPLDIDRIGQLSFHKHKSKRTYHQNECRACKKWRINDSFNPIRTHDQLHESSVITRERKLLLREPEILQAIKDRTGAGLKSQIWERFGRRCFYCKMELELEDVRLDHTRPLAYLWPIDEHATCLCADHNSQKSDKFPVDFYTKEQLAELAAITGLPLVELTARVFNEVELQRILSDPVTFAREWDPRLFASTARRLADLKPEIDLMAVLKKASPNVYAVMEKRLAERRESVGPRHVASS